MRFPDPAPSAALLAGLALVLVSAAGADPAWQVFTPEDLSFRVELPASPTTERKERWFPVSRFVSTVYKARRGQNVFGVNHTDIPGAILFVVRKKTILETTRKGFLESSGAREISFTPTQVDGRPAGELVYSIPATGERPKQRGTARMLFVGKRLFIFYTELAGSTPEEESLRYFASIRIAEPE